MAWEKGGVLLEVISLDAFPESSLRGGSAACRTGSSQVARSHCKPPVTGCPAWSRPPPTLELDSRPRLPASSLAPGPALHGVPELDAAGNCSPPGRAGWRRSPACSGEDPCGRRWSFRLEVGVRDLDNAGPQLFAARRPPGPSAGRGRERGAALWGARSGRAHGTGL